MNKFIKSNYKSFVFSLLYGILTYSLYFQAHYVHDSYRIYNFGFLQNLDGFWSQGRPMCMWFNILFNFIKINPRYGQILSVFLVIIFLSISANIIYKLILKRFSNNEKNSFNLKLIFILISNGLFFNIYITDWMLFFEGCVFALGCLFSVIGAYFIIEKQDVLKRYFISSIFFILGIFCYQATIAISGAIIVIFTIYDNKDKKILKILLNTLLYMVPYLIALMANFAFIKIINNGNVTDARLSGNINIIYNIMFTIKQFKWYYIDMFGYPTKYILAFLTFITFIFYIIKLVMNKEKKINILYIILSLFAIWFLSILPIVAMPSDNIYFISRSIPYISAVFPYMLLTFLVFTTTLFKKDRKIYLLLLVIYTLLISISIIKVTAECLKNNTQDIYIAKVIQYQIDKYEEQTKNKIDTIILLPDSKLSLNEKNINYYSDNTVRALSSDYGTREIMYFVSTRDYKVTEGTKEQKLNIFGDIEWDTFDMKQLKFEKNILYLVKY